MGVYTKFVVLI